jgi:hypothetical protein
MKRACNKALFYCQTIGTTDPMKAHLKATALRISSTFDYKFIGSEISELIAN